MQTVASQLQVRFAKAINDAFGMDADPLIGLSQNDKFGDYQSNAAMGLAKLVFEKTGQKTNPRQVAEAIKAKLDLGEMASEVSIAGPGFINVKLSPAWLAGQLATATGVSKTDHPQTVVVDYSGPNIAKAMHVGHYRGTIIGDAFCRILSYQGHNVIRQNHIGDWGLQMGMVTFAIESAGGKDLSLADLEKMYKQISKDSEDPATRRQMAERTMTLQQTPKADLHAWTTVRNLTLTAADEIYRRLGILLTMDDVRGESSYSDEYAPMVAQLLASGQAKETNGAIGVFPPGFKNREGEPRPFIIQSRDGSYQYPTFDLAALRYRVEVLKAERIIYTHDDRQAEHFAMLFATAHLLGWDQSNGKPVAFDYAPFGTILGPDGKPIKSRKGENIKLSELIEEAEQRALAIVKEKNPDLAEAEQKSIAHSVGIGAVKYADLSKDRTTDYIFDWDKLLSFEGNTAPYLQYVYARIQSIFRKAGSRGDGATIRLDAPQEQSLAKQILRFGEVIDLVARELKPHILANYLYELAGKFSVFFENCPVIQSEEPTRSSRLALCARIAQTMGTGLDLLGIEHPDQM